ncbi:MAG: thioesterase family protein [Pseudomonadaceae bacterium]|nr:thioesterase family protein [Pseudomonadaceae bacterium]
MDSIFERDGGYWLPTVAAMGPWGDSLHGGAPAALVCHCVETTNESDMPLARMTLDLFRPVPAKPLEVSVTELRRGRRLSVYQASVTHEGRELVRATALFAESPAGVGVGAAQARSLPLPGDIEAISLAESARREAGRVLGSGDGLHNRLLVQSISGGHGSGEAHAWLELPLQLAPEIDLSPLAHLAACSDFANGIAQRISSLPNGSRVGYINADISLHILREPSHGKVGMTARNDAIADGRAIVSAQCWDAKGMLARISQTALANPLTD